MTPGKNVIAGVNDTTDKLFAGVNDNADKLFTDNKLYWRQRSVSANRDKRPPRPLKLLQTKTAIFSFGGLRGLWSGCVGCLWMQLFMAVPMSPSTAMSDFRGQRYHRFVPFNFVLSLAAPHLHGVLVLVTGNKFIADVVVTGDNCSQVSLTPERNLSPVSTTPALTENLWQGLFAGVVDTGEQLIAGVVYTSDKHSSANISANFQKNSKRLR